jgi:hypothetical protein
MEERPLLANSLIAGIALRAGLYWLNDSVS